MYRVPVILQLLSQFHLAEVSPYYPKISLPFHRRILLSFHAVLFYSPDKKGCVARKPVPIPQRGSKDLPLIDKRQVLVTLAIRFVKIPVRHL